MTAPGFVEQQPDTLDKAVELRMKNPQPFHAFVRQFTAAGLFDSNERVHKIDQPTLIVLGREDPIFPIALAEDFRRKMPQAKMIIYEDCGHAIHLEKPDRLSKDMREFLKGN